MALLHIPLDQVGRSHLQALIDAAAPENRVIDYKRETYGRADKDHSEFLADIIRAPRSYSAPHRVVRQQSNRFWTRSSAGKYEPDVDELAYFDNLGGTLERHPYHFAEAIFETTPDSLELHAKTLRPVLDQMANAAGAASSASFDQRGNFITFRK